MVENKKEELESLKERFEELKELMTAERRKGRDLMIAEIQAMNIKPKIMMAKVTASESDLTSIKQRLDVLEKEIKQATFDNEPYLFRTEDYDLKRIRDKIENAKEYHIKGNKQMAISTYKEINILFKLLEPETKKRVLEDCVALHKLIG